MRIFLVGNASNSKKELYILRNGCRLVVVNYRFGAYVCKTIDKNQENEGAGQLSLQVSKLKGFSVLHNLLSREHYSLGWPSSM